MEHDWKYYNYFRATEGWDYNICINCGLKRAQQKSVVYYKIGETDFFNGSRQEYKGCGEIIMQQILK